MTLEEAQEIVKGFEPGMAIPYGQKTKDAINLLIKAGERCRHNYLNPQRADFRLLPGETEE